MADSRKRLVIATGNAGKLGEYRDLLAGTGLELVAYDTDVQETGGTYAANARLKAEAASKTSGLPALGDDSGLEVDVLDGFPGIRSARLGPTQKERTAALLERLSGRPRPWKGRFICTVAAAARVGSRPSTRCFPGPHTTEDRGSRSRAGWADGRMRSSA